MRFSSLLFNSKKYMTSCINVIYKSNMMHCIILPISAYLFREYSESLFLDIIVLYSIRLTSFPLTLHIPISSGILHIPVNLASHSGNKRAADLSK